MNVRKSSQRKRSRRRVRIYFDKRAKWVIAIAAVIILALILFIPTRNWCKTASTALPLDKEVSCAIIRDEQMIAVEKYDHVTHCVLEGDEIAPGDRIAYILKWGYSDDMLYSLLDIQGDIYEAQMEQLNGVTDSTLLELDNSILSTKEELRNAQMLNEGISLLDIEIRLTELLEQRSAYLKEKVYATEKLSELYAEEELRLDQISQWRSSIVSTTGGRVSFYLDGYEAALNASKLEIISYDILSSAIRGASVTNATAESSRQLYRVVNGNVWYCAFITNIENSYRVVEGGRYTVRFSGYGDTAYTGIALKAKVSGNYVINILRFDTDIGDFMHIRSLKAAIEFLASGIAAESSAIHVGEDGENYVILRSGDENSESVNIPVTVMYNEDDTAIFQSIDPNQTIYAGQELEMTQTNNLNRLIAWLKELI